MADIIYCFFLSGVLGLGSVIYFKVFKDKVLGGIVACMSGFYLLAGLVSIFS